MRLEQMAYKMQPAGHEEPPARRNYGEPCGELREKFEKWLGRTKERGRGQDAYNDALEIVKELKPTLDDAHGLLLSSQDHRNIKYSGQFISAIYNTVPDKNIVYDLDLGNEGPFDLCYNLPKDKRFVNLGSIGRITNPEGPIINYGTILGSLTLSGKSDLFLNFGRALYVDGFSGAPVISFRTYGDRVNRYGQVSPIEIHYGTPEKTTLGLNKEVDGRPKYIMPLRSSLFTGSKKFRKYLDDLKQKFEKGKENPQIAFSALDELGEEPGKKVQQDLEAIIYGRGNRV